MSYSSSSSFDDRTSFDSNRLIVVDTIRETMTFTFNIYKESKERLSYYDWRYNSSISGQI